MKLFLLLILFAIQKNYGQDSPEEKILYTYSHNQSQKTDNKDFLIVHAIPHSHDDVGWIETFDEYYYGSYSAQSTNVSQIFYSVLDNLGENPTHTFTISEIAFFQRWFDSLSKKNKEKVTNLIKLGQIEFVSGGWYIYTYIYFRVQNDEACTYYEDIIDQMTTGHQFLYENFEIVPNLGWQMDSFGHSKSQAYLFHQMGFDAFFMGRIDIYEEFQLLNQNMMKFMWKIDDETNIFSELFFLRYISPLGFEFDQKDNGANGEVDEKNLQSMSDKLVNYIKNVSVHYPGQNFIQLFGDDFTFQKAEYNYGNLSLLFDNINKNKDLYKMSINYSTPMRYLKALNEEKIDLKIDQQDEDFFPYRDVKTGFWTGFYSSRPVLKGFIIRAGKYLHSMRGYMLYEYLNQNRQFNLNFTVIKNSIRELEKAQAIMQHHDCITGTSTQDAADNYKLILQNGVEKFNKALFGVLKSRTRFDIGEEIKYELYEASIEDSLHPDQWKTQSKTINEYMLKKQNILISIYNPATFSVNKVVRLNVNGRISHYLSIDENENSVNSEYVCPDNNKCYLFLETQLKPLQMNYYKLVYTGKEDTIQILPTSAIGDQISMGNNELKFINQQPYHQERSFQYNQRNFSLRYGFYDSMIIQQQQNEGDYVFRPDSKFNQSYTKTTSNKFTKPTIFQGQLFSYMFFDNKELNLGLLLTKYSTHIQIQSQILELYLLSQGSCRDVVLEIKDLSLNNAGEFFTDSNGLFIELRKKKATDQSIAGNYYPITRLIMIQDKINSNKRITLFNDRSQGGSSIVPGSVELMIARRVDTNDNKGMPDQLDKDWNQLQFHQLSFDLSDEEIRKKQLEFDLHPQIFIGASKKDYFLSDNTKIRQISNIQINPLIKPTLRHWTTKEGQEYLILRLQNTVESRQNLDYQWNDIIALDQVTLTGNQNLEDLKRFDWCYEGKCKTNDYQQQDALHKTEIEPLGFQSYMVQPGQNVQNFLDQSSYNSSYKSKWQKNYNKKGRFHRKE